MHSIRHAEGPEISKDKQEQIMVFLYCLLVYFLVFVYCYFHFYFQQCLALRMCLFFFLVYWTFYIYSDVDGGAYGEARAASPSREHRNDADTVDVFIVSRTEDTVKTASSKIYKHMKDIMVSVKEPSPHLGTLSPHQVGCSLTDCESLG
jgi:hypothetical protein